MNRNFERIRIWKETVVTPSNVLLLHLSGLRKNMKAQSRQSITLPRFEPDTYQTQVLYVTNTAPY
jgi:hypothetical protein